MARPDPVSGVVPRDEFKALVDAPYGHAAKVIRKYDPLFGRAEGEPIKWRVTLSREITETAEVIVEAASADEAEDMVDAIPDKDLNWDVDTFSTDYEIDSVEPVA